VGAPLLDALSARRDSARTELLAGMRSQRYAALLDALVDAALDPRVLPEAGAPAVDVLPRLAAAPWRALAKAVKRAGDDPPDETLHRIRIRAKRARYAADVAALVVGKPAARFASAVAEVQEVLGDHQDACVRGAWLRRAGADVAPASAVVAGRLVELARADGDRARAEWPRVWKAASAGELRTWLSR
jgi:CHAD domain-containing protein